MAAVTKAAPVVVRAARPGEGAAVAGLWRELWDAHESWGGYPGSRDARVYAQIAARLDDDARVRAGQVMLGRHAHLIAEIGGTPCGQVEGWIDQLGIAPSTPMTCEVRSLIVAERARRGGAGRALLETLGQVARERSGNARCVLAAEVLEPNPAHAFYENVGYAPTAWSARVDARALVAGPRTEITARLAIAQDALAIARLEAALAGRRRLAGDLRFDRPRAVDAALVQAIAAHLASEPAGASRDPVTLVAADAAGLVRGAATFTVQLLEPPFLPLRRALLGRFALDSAWPAAPLVAALVGHGSRLAASHGAQYVELTDLSAPGTELHAATLATGAVPWSRVVTRLV
jgi:GNAT superfamily N-acetyltransferase